MTLHFYIIVERAVPLWDRYVISLYRFVIFVVLVSFYERVCVSSPLVIYTHGEDVLKIWKTIILLSCFMYIYWKNFLSWCFHSYIFGVVILVTECYYCYKDWCFDCFLIVYILKRLCASWFLVWWTPTQWMNDHVAYWHHQNFYNW